MIRFWVKIGKREREREEKKHTLLFGFILPVTKASLLKHRVNGISVRPTHRVTTSPPISEYQVWNHIR